MAHFAQLDSNDIVTQVIVVNNENLIDKFGQESEDRGISFCKSLFGEDTRWVQTSYNKNFRQNFAQIGFQYESNLDVFIPPQPFPSWIIDPNTYTWIPPVPIPDEIHDYRWIEETQKWERFYDVPEPPDGYYWSDETESWEHTPRPNDGNNYNWNSETKSWDII